jgi:hypothetical protein
VTARHGPPASHRGLNWQPLKLKRDCDNPTPTTECLPHTPACCTTGVMTGVAGQGRAVFCFGRPVIIVKSFTRQFGLVLACERVRWNWGRDTLSSLYEAHSNRRNQRYPAFRTISHWYQAGTVDHSDLRWAFDAEPVRLCHPYDRYGANVTTTGRMQRSNRNKRIL